MVGWDLAAALPATSRGGEKEEPWGTGDHDSDEVGDADAW